MLCSSGVRGFVFRSSRSARRVIAAQRPAVVRGGVESPTLRFSGVAYGNSPQVARVSRTANDRGRQPLAEAVAVTVAVIRGP
jgi:hypothetical protein